MATIDDISSMSAEAQQAMARELLGEMFLGAMGRITPFALFTAALIAFVIYLRRRPGPGFVAWLFPRRIYSGASFWVDVKLYVFNRLLRASGLIGVITLSPLLAGWLQRLISGAEAPQSLWHPLLVGAALFCVSDLSTYIVHRFYHENSRLWPFHAVHHSAEELNPLTVDRQHPVYVITSALVRGVLLGLLQGLLLGLLIGKVDAATIMGTNAFYYLFNVAGSNLRHSHVWLSFGPMIEHVIISPAQHQIHHSTDPRHFNKNYGEVLAVWDWMFGTLYVPRGQEELQFGLGDGRGGRDAQPHPTLRAALIGPFRAAFAPRPKPGE